MEQVYDVDGATPALLVPFAVVFSQLLALIWDFGLELGIFIDLVLVLQSFLLLESIYLHNLEVRRHTLMLAFSEKEKAGLLFIDTSHHPLVVIDIIVNFLWLVSDSRDHHECALEVLRQNVLILVALEHCVQVW